MYLDSGAEKLINVFADAGFDAYAVGGCVRDSLMGRPVSDYDLAVPCPPQITEEVLSKNGIRFIETGLKHGTVTAVINLKPYEITTFRTEQGYSDNRRPDSVSFVTDITADLSRRDFTVNAMAYNPRLGLVDEFGGRHDLKAGVLRTVGDPDTRFSEDALRILRAVRFASTLGFEVEFLTARSIIKNSPSLLNVASERITAELEKFAAGQNSVAVLNRFAPALSHILPSVDKICEKHALDTALAIMQKLPRSLDFLLAMLALVAYSEKCEIHASENEIFGLIKPSKSLKNKVNALISNYNITLKADKAFIKQTLSKLPPDVLCDVITLKLAFNNDSELVKIKRLLSEIVNNNEPYLVSQLDIDGEDIIALGFEGKRVGELLQKALDLVISGEIKNDKRQILKHII